MSTCAFPPFDDVWMMTNTGENTQLTNLGEVDNGRWTDRPCVVFHAEPRMRLETGRLCFVVTRIQTSKTKEDSGSGRFF